MDKILYNQLLADLKYIKENYGDYQSISYDSERLYEVFVNPTVDNIFSILKEIIKDYYVFGYLNNDGKLIALPIDNDINLQMIVKRMEYIYA
jgi:hypothetical protein